MEILWKWIAPAWSYSFGCAGLDFLACARLRNSAIARGRQVL
jgi:hypothetical protein